MLLLLVVCLGVLRWFLSKTVPIPVQIWSLPARKNDLLLLPIKVDRFRPCWDRKISQTWPLEEHIFTALIRKNGEKWRYVIRLCNDTGPGFIKSFKDLKVRMPIACSRPKDSHRKVVCEVWQRLRSAVFKLIIELLWRDNPEKTLGLGGGGVSGLKQRFPGPLLTFNQLVQTFKLMSFYIMGPG